MALYTKNAASISARCSLQIRKTQSISIPSQIAPNIWILTTAPSALTIAITVIYPGETTKNYCSKEAKSDLVTPTSLQYYITQLPSTPTL